MLRWPLASFRGAPKIRASSTPGAAQYSFVGWPLAGLGVSASGVPVLNGGAPTGAAIADAGPAAVPVDTAVSLYALTGAGNKAVTLAAGSVGQHKTIILTGKTGAGNLVITPVALHGYTTVTLAAVGASVTFRWEASKWAIVAVSGGSPGVVPASEGGLDDDEEVLAAGALNPFSLLSRLKAAGAVPLPLTLADLPSTSNDFEKVLVLESKTGVANFILTPDNVLGLTSITFNSVGDAVKLRWLGSIGMWVVVTNRGAVLV